ncbi:hypothetical protein ACHAQH_004427 [Verticillium albo-atrum]
MLAILKAGGAFCPLNLDAPPERIKFILKDVNARVVLSTPDLASKIPADELGVSLITLTVNDALEVPSDIPTMEQDLPRIENVLPESLAYVMSKMLDDLPAVMTAMNVDACELTPTVAGSLLRTRANVPSLKLLLTIGEITLQTGFMADYSPRVIGAPLDTVSCFIAEIPPDGATPTFSLAPIGQVGELVVGGHQLARNYLNRPEKTDAAFIDSPFGRLYRTGDKASMRPDGTLECLGRISEGQIKLRGQRIELGEVEQAAMRVPDCRDVVSMVIDNILVVFCVPEDSSTNFTSDIILQTCSKWLPAFMIPGDVAIIEEFPRLPSGKIDRHQMRRNYEEARHTEPLETQHEMDVLEEKITAAVSNLLGSPVAPLDVMSAHGIDSLKAIQLGSALRKEGFPISTLDIVSSRTVAALCAKVRAADTEAQSPSHISQPPDTERILSTYTTLRDMEFRIEALDWCTSLQSSMLFETSVSISAYHNLMELELPPSCSLKKARASLEQVVKQNDILRSGFVQDGAVFVRVVFSSLEETQIQCVDHFTLSEPRDQDDYESIWLYPFQAQIAVSQDGAPPRLQLRMHHAIYDGWTVDLIMRDLSAILNGQETDRRPQFSEISALLTALPPTELDSSRAFWAEHLINWQKLSFPRLMSRPPDSLEPQSASRRLAVLDHELNEASRKLGCHPQVFFQATMAWIWGAILGTSDIVIGCVSSGRTLPVEGIEQIMGPCIASLPLRTNLEALRSVTDLLRSTQAANRKFLQYGILPLSEIRKAAGVKPGDALFDLLMVYQQSLYSHDRHTSSVREVSRRDFLETKILVEIEPNPNGIMCHLTYHADALSSDFAELLLDQIDCITRQFLADPSGLLSEVSKGAPSTLESIYNPRPATFSDCPDLATLFERSASAAPNAEAICFARSIAPTEIDSDVISYDELNNMSNKVAWYLHRKGVSQDPSRPAYIIYTSGTTGVPKGIVVTQLNITSNLDVLSRIYPSDTGSRFLQLCSQAFDVSVFEIFFTWTTGACLCAGSNDTLFADLEQSIRSLSCTHLSLTPTVAALVSPQNVPRVSFLVTAGEPMTSAVSRSWGEYLFQGYGPAETTNICTVKKMKEGDFINHLGFAFDNVSAFVLSIDSTSLVPRGCFGEFCFGGDQVAKGYIDLPEVTSSKFIDHPSLGRIYRSGDMGRMLPDGSLLVSGRLDGQVKLRGQRIETGEIDSIVTATKEVVSCASLILQPPGSSSEQLVAFYTPVEDHSAHHETLETDGRLASLNQRLFAELASRLPVYMVPSYLVPLVAIPQTSSGKIDKTELRNLFRRLSQNQLSLAAKAQTDRTDVEEWSEAEKLVAQVIAQSLKVPQDIISRWQPLATIGLDSISAISVARSIGAALGRRIPISHILQNPYVARLAQLATESDPDKPHIETETADSPFFSQESDERVATQFAEQKRNIQDILPCTPLQEAMLSATGDASYSNQLIIRLSTSSSTMFSSLRSIQKIVSSPGRSLFDTILLLQPPKKQLDLAVWELIQDTGGMDIPLVCELIPNARDDSVEINLHTNSPSLDPSTSSCLLQTFSHILQRIAQHPAGAIPTEADLPEDLRPGLAKGFHQLRQHDLDKQSSNALHQSIKSSLEDSWTKQEEIIRAVLSKLSGTAESRISRKTTIFQLGLDSINAVQIAAVLRKQGLDASTFDVIECPSSSELAQKIASRGENQRQTYSVYDIDAFKRAVGSAVQVQLSMQAEEIMPCTPVQCGMLKDFIKSEGMDYLNYLALDLDQRISTVQVEDAWKKLVQMHAILRTGFAPVDHPDAPFAMVQYPTTMSSSNTNLTRVDTPFNVEDWKADCSRHVLSSLDLPPWRITLAVQGQATVLHLMIHHALYDAYSLDKLLSDLGHIMSGGILPQSHESIRDAVSAILGSASTDGPAKAFWQEKSSEAILNRFPTMTPLIESFSVTYTKKLRSRLNFTALQSQASAAGVSIQAVLQAAWTRLLSAYLGEQTLVFGVVVSGRTLPSTEDAMFPCITTVPVISRNNGSNAELLSQTMEYNSQLLAHQHAPLSKIQHWLGHPGTRLFDTLLVYQKTASASESAPKLPWRQISDEGRLDYALSLEVEPSNNGHVDLRLSSRTDVLPQEQARIVLGQFDTILADLAANPGGQEKQIWLENPELAAILPPRDQEIQSEEMYLHQFVETTAKTHPSRLALEFVTAFRGDTPESHGFTFKELNEMGNRVANTLAQQITTRGIVAVHFEKCPEAFFAILGILKAGCSFLALDPSAPKARKEFILEDSRAVALLTRGDSLDFQPAQTVIEINQNKLHEASDEPCHLGDDLSKDDTCYCLYTSGTTGTPKGCEITHENAVQAMKAFQRLFAGHWDDESRWLQFASFHFDVSVLEQYWSWSVAMPLIVVPRTMILDNIAATIQRLRITHLDLTPSLARLLDPKDVPTLCRGVFITGGEALKQEILDTWGPQGVIYNAYGPTEATIGVTMYQRVPRNGRASNIGRQFDNVGTYVLEPGTENPVMKGAVGELCVSGKLVGKGYLNRPELTAERFPVLQYFKEKIYRTGDLVRVLHDGCFEFLGRADDQVKLRGQRLEIGEINHAIRTGVAAVKDVVTLVTKHPKADKDLLVTFVTSSEAATSTVQLEVLSGAETAKLRQAVLKACRNKLPGYMVPSHVFEVPFIPLSINNKAEMKVLGRLFASLTPELLLQVSSTTPSRQIQPATKMQRTILGAVSSFSGLPVAELSLSSNLFDLGIDSISCLRLSRSLKQDGLPTASPSLLLRNPVLGDLAEALSDPYDSKDLSAIREAHQHIQAFGHRFTHEIRQTLSLSTEDEVEYISPCTPLQEGMLSRTFTKGEESYFVAFRLKLSNDVDASQLRKSWDRLVARHPILRTRFVPTSGGFAQVALPPSAVPWAKYAVDNAEIEAVLQEAHSAWVKHNQNSIIKPLECLLVNSAGGSLLVVHIFHALYDGTSLDTMLQWLADDLSQRPHAQSSSFLNALPYGPLQNFDDSRPFWSQHLSSCTFEPLPRLMTADSTASHSMRRNYNIERLRETSKALNITLQSTILALWSGTFGKHFSPRAAMGVVVSGRAIDIDSAEGVIGPLFNTLPFHPDLAANNTWQKLTQRCHDFNTSTLPFQHVPLRNIQKWCCGGHPILDNLFVFQNDAPLANDASSLWTLEDSFMASDYPLAFEATAKGETDLQVQLVVRQDVVTESDLQRIFEDFEEAMFALSTGRAGTLRNPTVLLASQESSAGASPLTTRSASTDSAGHSTDVSAPEFTMSSFEWTETALAARDEISKLAQVSIESISESTSLLELGLDSIDLVSLSTRLKQKGLDITMSQLLRAQTIESMEKIAGRDGSRLSDERAQSAFETLIPRLYEAVKATGYNMENIENVLPATPLQESMMADMIDSDFERYFNHDIMEISPETVVESLLDAWRKVIFRSPILRTVFVQIDDPKLDQTFCQVIISDQLPSVRYIQLQDKQEIDNICADHRRIAKEANGLSQLLQLTIAHVGEQSYLMFSIAHALYDGWSLALLHQDVNSAYHNTLKDRPAPQEALESLLQPPSDRSQKFWSQYLAGAHLSLLPETTASPNDSLHHCEATSSVSSDVVALYCRNNSVTLQVLGQACWASVLATRLSALDVTFGVILSGRDTEEAQGLMFPTMNTVALRCILHGSTTSFLRYLQDTMADVHEHQAFPLRKAQLAGKQTPGRLFNTLFLLQRQPEASQDHTNAGSLVKSIQSSAATDFAVCVELEATKDQLVWRIAGKEAFTAENDLKEILQQLDRAMVRFVKGGDGSLIQFEGDHTSVCQLQPFAWPSDGPNPNSDVQITSTSTAKLPESEVESIIRGVLSEVSGIPYETISRDSTSYNLGLDSISLIKVSSLLKRNNIYVSIHGLLTASSLWHMASLANHPPETPPLDAQEIHSKIPESVKLNQILSATNLREADVVEILPAVPMQVYMMTAWQKSGGRVFYPTFRYQLNRHVSLETMQQGWSALVAAEAILRTCLVPTGDSDTPFLQIVLGPNVIGPHSQMSLPGNGSSSEDLSKCWPQVRMTAEQLIDGAWQLSLHIHHALYDGITLPSILNKLRHFLTNTETTMTETKFSQSWRSFVARHQSPSTVQERKSFWTEYLSGYCNPAPHLSQGASENRFAHLQRSAAVGMNDLVIACASNGVGLPALFFAVVAQSLYARRASRTGSVILGIYYSNRKEEDDTTMAFYPTLNLVPLTIMIQGETKAMDVARQVQQDLHRITSLVNSTVGLWEIKEWTGIEIDVFVNFLNLPKETQTSDMLQEVVDEQLFNEIDSPRPPTTPWDPSLDAPWLKNNAVLNAFPAAMDIEASVHGDALDVGVFGSAARATTEETRALVDIIGEGLSAALGG